LDTVTLPPPVSLLAVPLGPGPGIPHNFNIPDIPARTKRQHL